MEPVNQRNSFRNQMRPVIDENMKQGTHVFPTPLIHIFEIIVYQMNRQKFPPKVYFAKLVYEEKYHLQRKYLSGEKKSALD